VALVAARDHLNQRAPAHLLLGSERVRLPSAARERLREVVEALAAGHEVTVVDHERLLSTQQAADLLGVSRPHVVKLIDAGEIAHEMAGTHRRVRAGDVIAYRERRATERRKHLDELTRRSEELDGGYR